MLEELILYNARSMMYALCTAYVKMIGKNTIKIKKKKKFCDSLLIQTHDMVAAEAARPVFRCARCSEEDTTPVHGGTDQSSY